MNLMQAWNAKLAAGSFLPSKNLCRKCEKLKQASLSLSLKIIIIKAKTNNDKNKYLRKKYQVQILNFWPIDLFWMAHTGPEISVSSIESS